MSTATAPPPVAAGPGDASRGAHRRRRPRRTPNTPPEQQDGGHAQAHALVPSQVMSQQGGRTATPPARGGRGGRARGRGPRFGPRMAAGGRQFGGQLTAEHDASPEAASPSQAGLHADAPTFQPGQPIATRKQRAPREKKPQLPKSSAPDIATRTHEDIDNGHYECAICTEEVKRHSRGVWSCRTCWTVFHLGCIKKWSTNEGSAAARQQAQDGELPPPRQWRCPGCNLPKDVLPKNFHCWCEKELDPRALPGLPPFSCGQTCARPRVLPKSCPHPCPVTCHAGPCPPCNLMGPTKPCFCGKKSVTRRCVDTDYEHGWGCGELCGELLACGEHRCPQPCHDGPCGACEVRVPARCYCGQIQKDILCRDRADEKQSRQYHAAADGTAAMEEWTGTFRCPNLCRRPFDCGKHTCQKSCHEQDAQPPRCPRSPNLVKHCPCGKTLLQDMPNATRTTCEDHIPNCTKPCHKTLDCGHPCEQLCHQGPCSPCFQRVSISCRCGRTTSTSICHQGTEEPPQCMRICRVSLNCGRHECGERCCAGERKAAERQSNRRKARPLNAAPRRPGDNFEAEHICTRSCGRQLKCGNPEHRCQELCHKGPCGTCREAIFDELSCHCGRTVLQPPLPCGTKPPPCRFACERPKDCGHPQMAHNCHQDEEKCPKCPFLTTKSCLCGKNVLKNQPCWLSDVRCGDVCGKTLPCGAHKCQKQCHRPGECEEPCTQPCGKELSVCGHPCLSPCHFPSACKEEKPCQHKIFITCECQRIKQEAKCAASGHGDGNIKKTLKCDEECARLERNRKLALALNVDPEHQNDHVPYSTETLNMYQQNSTWAAGQEKQLRLFAADPDAKRFRFKPMQRHQRAFVHSLAEDFGFDTESMDPEPHRHVAIFKTPRFVMAPMKTLAECARTRQVQRPIPVPTAATALRPKPSNTTGDPYNAFLVTNPRFALTIEEVSGVVKGVLAKTSFSLELEVNFLPSEAVTLKPPLVARLNMEEQGMQKLLESIQEPLSQAFMAQKIGKVQLARLDSSLNILRKESDIGPGSGWSTVAATKGAPLRQVARGTAFGNKGGFAVLSLSSSKKKKLKPVEVVEDWEAAEEQEEEREKASGANSAVMSENEEGSASRRRSIVAAEASSDEPALPTTPGTARWADMEEE
jgi:transcriptional repressor NF-X1